MMNYIFGIIVGGVAATAAGWLVLGPLGRGCVNLFGGL